MTDQALPRHLTAIYDRALQEGDMVPGGTAILQQAQRALANAIIETDRIARARIEEVSASAGFVLDQLRELERRHEIVVAERDALKQDAELFRMLFPDEAGRALARETLRSARQNTTQPTERT